MSFTSPSAALEAISECLEPMSPDHRHTGLFGSGETLDCCYDGSDDPLIRVESVNARARDGVVLLHGLSRTRCKDLVLDVVVTYQSCFQPFDGDSADPVAISVATSRGTELAESWWEALKRIACCSGTNQQVRFQSIQDLAPEGGCAGWVMRLEADLSICDCSDVS